MKEQPNWFPKVHRMPSEWVQPDSFPDLSRYDIYASGPPAMVYAGKAAFEKCQLPMEHYYSDAFEFQEPRPDK